MPTLFLLFRSDPMRKEMTFRLANAGDAVILVPERAATITSIIKDEEISDLTRREVRILVLNADEDTDITGIKDSVENIGYDKLVDLLIRYDRVYS